MKPESDTPAALADRLNRGFVERPFGIIRFWRFAVVRPNDQSYVLVSAHAAGDRLDLRLLHASRQGSQTLLSLWRPHGLGTPPPEQGRGIAIATAERLRWGDAEAWLDGDRYHIRTSRGEGAFPVNGAPALTLAY